MQKLLILIVFSAIVSGRGQGFVDFSLQNKPALKQKQQTKIVDNWFGVDKGRHLVASFILTGFSQLSLHRYFKQGKQQAQYGSIGFSISVGLGKELWDSTKKGNHFSCKDLTANLVGSLLAILILAPS